MIPRSSPKANVSQVIGVCTVSVAYGRPSVRGRKIFGELVPFGEVWRAGANEATTITFRQGVRIDGKKVAAGKYVLFMIPQKKKWTIILNKDSEQWGAYNYNPGDDVLRTEVKPRTVGFTELCTYTFTDVGKTRGVLRLTWENHAIDLEIETDTHIQTLEEIERVTTLPKAGWYSFSAAAQYHFYERQEPEKALGYIDRAIALEAPNPAPWMLKSQILASQKKYREAIHLAQQAIKVSKKYNFLFEVEENEENIHKWETQ